MGLSLNAGRVIAIAIMTTLWGCGSDLDPTSKSEDSKRNHSSPAATADANSLAEPDATVRACVAPAAPTAASLGFNLASSAYATSIVPIVTAKCIRCHGGEGSNGQQNSTTCGYLEKNIDNVILRLQNGMAGEALRASEDAREAAFIATIPSPTPTPAPTLSPPKLSNNQIRDQISNNVPANWPMPPISQSANRRVTQAEIDAFIAWKSVPDKCADTSTADAALPTVVNFTDDDAQNEKLIKEFSSTSCEDGPAVAPDRAVVESLMAIPDGSPSAFYDYEKKEFVMGARKMDGNCTIDYFMTALAVVPGAADVLKSYKDFGWWTTNCAVVDGRPQAYLAHVARVTTALGDKTYGLFIKPLIITDK